jgi:hypothetical protein
MCPFLETLNLCDTPLLQSLIIKAPMEHLKNIDLAFSGIPTIAIEAPCPLLERLNLYQTSNLQSMIIKDPMEHLKNITLSQSAVQTIAIEAPCSFLDKLMVNEQRKLQSLIISEPLPSLEYIDGAYLNVEDIYLIGRAANAKATSKYIVQIGDFVHSISDKNTLLKEIDQAKNPLIKEILQKYEPLFLSEPRSTGPIDAADATTSRASSSYGDDFMLPPLTEESYMSTPTR